LAASKLYERGGSGAGRGTNFNLEAGFMGHISKKKVHGRGCGEVGKMERKSRAKGGRGRMGATRPVIGFFREGGVVTTTASGTREIFSGTSPRGSGSPGGNGPFGGVGSTVHPETNDPRAGGLGVPAPFLWIRFRSRGGGKRGQNPRFRTKRRFRFRGMGARTKSVRRRSETDFEWQY